MTIVYISTEDTKKPIPIYITHRIKKMEVISKERKQARENKKERCCSQPNIQSLNRKWKSTLQICCSKHPNPIKETAD